MKKSIDRLDHGEDVLTTTWSVDLGDSIQQTEEVTNVYHDDLWEGIMYTQDPKTLADFFTRKIEKTIKKMQEKGYRQLTLKWHCSKYGVDEE